MNQGDDTARRAADGPELGADVDKYALLDLPRIDCATLLPLCRARCCSLVFALAPQDLVEGVVRFDPARPYRIARRASGDCVHHDGERCGVYAHRPAPCRRYDCRNDPRIWHDFEARIPAAEPGQMEEDS